MTTLLSAQVYKDAQQDPLPQAKTAAVDLLEDYLEELDTFSQWSTQTEGGCARDIAFAGGYLDENGKAMSAARVTDLIAASYVEAVRIYLQVRGLR